MIGIGVALFETRTKTRSFPNARGYAHCAIFWWLTSPLSRSRRRVHIIHTWYNPRSYAITCTWPLSPLRRSHNQAPSQPSPFSTMSANRTGASSLGMTSENFGYSRVRLRRVKKLQFGVVNPHELVRRTGLGRILCITILSWRDKVLTLTWIDTETILSHAGYYSEWAQDSSRNHSVRDADSGTTGLWGCQRSPTRKPSRQVRSRLLWAFGPGASSLSSRFL